MEILDVRLCTHPVDEVFTIVHPFPTYTPQPSNKLTSPVFRYLTPFQSKITHMCWTEINPERSLVLGTPYDITVYISFRCISHRAPAPGRATLAATEAPLIIRRDGQSRPPNSGGHPHVHIPNKMKEFSFQSSATRCHGLD